MAKKKFQTPAAADQHFDRKLKKALKDELAKKRKADRAKKKATIVDGLNAKDIKNLRNAIRQIWQRSHVRKLVVARCTHADGFTYCEKCGDCTPQLKIDHLFRVGDLRDPGYIDRMFTQSANLQGLCKDCHDLKTNQERQQAEIEKGFY